MPAAVEGFISRLERVGIDESRYLLRGYRNGEISPIEVYQRGARLLERVVISLQEPHAVP